MTSGWVKSLLLSAALLAGAGQAAAEPITPLTTSCLSAVSQQYGVHTDVLLALLIVEGGTVGKNSRANDNGSYDIGPFQINSIHLPTLAKMGITETQLRNNGCVNATVAAWHLRRVVMQPSVLRSINDTDTYLRAIARYHSATPQHNERYANLLRRAFQRLYASSH